MHTFRYFWIVLLVWSAILSLSAQDEPINLRERWGFIASIGTSVIDLDTGFQVVGVGVTIDSTGTIPITGYFQASFGYNGVMDTMAFITFPDQSFECWEPTLQRDLSGRLWNAGKVFGEKADPVVFFFSHENPFRDSSFNCVWVTDDYSSLRSGKALGAGWRP